MLPLINDNDQQKNSVNTSNNKNLSKLLQMKMNFTTMMTDQADAAATATATMAAHINYGELLINQLNNNNKQQFYSNNHIIENFIDSVKEMNDVVLIPSKLIDLEPLTDLEQHNTMIQDNLYSYYQMINVINNDLFDTQNHPQIQLQLNDLNNIFMVPKRKISRQQQRQQNSCCGHNTTTTSVERLSNSRSVSTTNLSATIYGNGNGNGNGHNDRTSPILSSSSSSSSEVGSSDLNDNSQMDAANDQLIMNNEQPEQQQCARRLALQFINHLHSLYSILEHFTQAADIITERYIKEFEQSA